eukprot:6124386-Heterocapsa_arctica.AAC.1
MGWTTGMHDQALQCHAHTGLAYDAFVTVAVVLDRLLASTGLGPDALTPAQFMEEFRKLDQPDKAINCITGTIILDEKQDRLMP